MGVEVVGFEQAQGPADVVSEVEILNKESDNKPIQFGSHGDEPVKVEANDVSEANFPKDAADEWPAPKQVHHFYFPKYRPYEDPKLKVKMDLNDKEIQKKNQARFQLIEELKAKKSVRAELHAQLKALRVESDQYFTMMDEKKKEREPLHQALGKLRDSGGVTRGGGLCSSEEELDSHIYAFTYRMQHESIPLSEEKQILREIKQLEATRQQVIANAAMREKIQDEMGRKETIQDQYKLIGVDMDGVRKEHQGVKTKITNIKESLDAVNEAIGSLENELTSVTEKRDKAYGFIQDLRKQRDEGNTNFFQSRAIMNKVKDLAAKKDVAALEELSLTEVDKFMSLFSNDKAFRDDYEKRILPSLDQRQLSRDGRIRNPDEKPLVVIEAPIPTVVETVAKANGKRTKEDLKSPPQQDTVPVQKATKAAPKAIDPTPIADKTNIAVKEEIDSYEIPKKNSISPEEVVDAAKLKEMKREEEMEKAKLAMDRKKKLAEKSAAKAAIRAQKEAEKKLKDKEKKLKKKASGSGPAAEAEQEVEATAEIAETEKVEVDEPEAPTRTKGKVKEKEKSTRQRPRPRGTESVPKFILKRRKSINYWLWAAPAALLVLVFLVLGYFYLL